MPLLTALILGLMTIFSPCPFCSNIAAVSYIAKDIHNQRLIILNGLLYTLGKMLTYTLLSLIFIFGAQITPIQQFFERYGEPALGPFLIVCALFMLIIGKSEERPHEHNHGIGQRIKDLGNTQISSPLYCFLMGLVFSLAFCPYSGVLFFGMLVPLTMAQPIAWSWTMPLLYGFATGFPVVIIAVILARSLTSMKRINENIMVFEKWLRWICAAIFFITGIILTLHFFFPHEHVV